MQTLIIATGNAHKVDEIRGILGSGFRYLTLKDFPAAPEVVEDAGTFAGNATKKAVALARFLTTSTAPKPALVLADDSGLEVHALNGAPGVYSARFAALDSGHVGNSPTADNNAKLLRLLADVPPEKRTARFRCVIALTPIDNAVVESTSPVCYVDEVEFQTELFEGSCEGRIGLTPSGGHGFGYDPLFTPEGFDKTFAELGGDVKNRISHRAKALAKLKLRLDASKPARKS